MSLEHVECYMLYMHCQAGLRMENPVEDAYSFRVENRWTSRDSIGLVAVLVVPRTLLEPYLIHKAY